ncbi:hypothetical protein [Sinosporangium siamense]|uniref:Uncharacterized protein n=1 Tax=Sinosporangium siamense TaxID=1367973 RepID=A0A919RLJ5_9ACTN|nr:hypothetical protein [Sinosporangium siamense]GII94346.1 hypothetical protein Ssi02_45770 [Sinosporangium siamense]
MHWHAYSWTGQGRDRENDALRRPSRDAAAHAAFTAAAIAPNRTCDWLLKRSSQIKATFHEPDRAVAWLGEQWDVVAPMLMHFHDHRARRLALAEVDLPGGVDVQWGDWLTGGRFASVAVICCPNFHAPGYPCPTGLR